MINIDRLTEYLEAIGEGNNELGDAIFLEATRYIGVEEVELMGEFSEFITKHLPKELAEYARCVLDILDATTNKEIRARAIITAISLGIYDYRNLLSLHGLDMIKIEKDIDKELQDV